MFWHLVKYAVNATNAKPTIILNPKEKSATNAY